MYSKLIEEGLLANPDFVECPERWRDHSLFLGLKEKGIDIKKTDQVFREHHLIFLVISEWLGARDAMKNIGATPGPGFYRIFPRVAEALPALKRIKGTLGDKLKKLFGTKAMSKLTKDDPKQWPSFTALIIDLYNYMLPWDYKLYADWRFRYIAGLLKEYYPAYFQNYTPNNVKTRLMKHIKTLSM